MPEPAISSNDRAQFGNTLKDPAFWTSNPDEQKKKLSSLPLLKSIPEEQRGQFINEILQRKDAIQKMVGEQAPTAPPPKPEGPSAVDKAATFATTPVSEMVLGPGKNMRNWEQQGQREHPNTNKPGTVGDIAHRASDTAFDQLAGFVDAAQTPLGIVTAGIGPKIRAIETAGMPLASKALAKGAQWAEKAVRYGYAGEQVSQAITGIKEALANPSVENITKALMNASIAGAITHPEAKKAVDGILRSPKSIQKFTEKLGKATAAGAEGFKRGASGKPPEPASKAPTAEQDGLEHAEVAKKLPIDQLSARTFEARGHAQELNSLRGYNEQAGGKIRAAEERLTKLKNARTEAELDLKDTKSFDKEIAQMEGRLSEIRGKVSSNHTKIESLKSQGVEEQSKAYEAELLSREAPPKPTGVKRYPAPTPVKAVLEAGKEQRQLPPSPKAAPGGIPRSTANPQKGPFAAGPVTGTPPQPEVTPVEGEAKPIRAQSTRELPAPAPKAAIEAPEERTPEGAIRAKAAEPVRTATPPVRGKLPVPSRAVPPLARTADGGLREQENTQSASRRQLPAAKNKYQPYTVESDEGGKTVNVIQPNDQARSSKEPKPDVQANTPQWLEGAGKETKAAYERLKEKHADHEATSSDLKEVGKHVHEAGAKTFEEWSKKMRADVGSFAESRLEEIWRQIKE